MAKGTELMRRPEQGMRALEPGIESSIGDRNWHAVSSALEAAIDSLSHRTPEELAGSLAQLEEMLPDLNAEMGMVKDVLDLEPVGPVKKFAAMIFSRFFPAFNSIVRRAEMREGATAKEKNLTRVRDQLVELRIKLADKIDEAIEMSLASDPELGGQLNAMREYEGTLRAQLLRIEESNFVKKLDTYLNIAVDTETNRGGGGVLSPYILLYEEIAAERIVPESQERISTNEVVSKLIGLKSSLESKLQVIQKRREGFLQPKRLALTAGKDRTEE